MSIRGSLVSVGVLAAVTLGCAANLPRDPTTFRPSPTHQTASIVLAKDVEVTPSTGYTRTLKAGSTWIKTGAVPQGDVYRIDNDVFQLEGAHMHEAHAVINAGRLVGFYLPFEQAFVSLSPDVPLSINNK